jgi:hypothetical protein
MEQCMDYDAASAGGRSWTCQEHKTASGSRRGDDDGIPVKLLSINTSVGCESKLRGEWIVGLLR